jgi:apolipoprotein N-acyltransferase
MLMSFVNKVSPYVWLVLFAILMLFNGGKWTIPFVAWIASVFGLLYILSVPHFWRGILLLLIATYIPIVIAWYGVVPFPMPIYPIFMLVNAIAAILPFAIMRLIIKRLDIGFAQTLIFPIVSTGIEFFMMSDSPLGSFGASAYTQHAFTWLIQIVSITGLWGIVFLVSWFASTVVWCLQADRTRSQVILASSIYGAVLILAVGFGFFRLAGQSDDNETVVMAGITAQSIEMGDLMGTYSDDVDAFRTETQAIHALYIGQTLTAIESDAELVLWAELAGVGVEEDVSTLHSELEQIAQDNSVYLAVPVFILFPDDSERPAENRLYIIDPDGETVIDHVKYGGNILEGSLAGDAQIQVIDTPFGRMSGVICWDTDYPEVIRQAGEEDVDILLSPSYIWDEVANIHFDMAAFRAIENGMTLVRQSNHGLSGVITPYGNALTRVDTGTDTLLLDVPINTSFDTLFPQTGTIIGQVSFIGLLVLLVTTIVVSFMHRREG